MLINLNGKQEKWNEIKIINSYKIKGIDVLGKKFDEWVSRRKNKREIQCVAIK